MKLPDTNVLVHAANRKAPEHESAFAWLRDSYAAPGGIALTWVALLGFVRVSTRHGILPQPLSVRDALRTMNFWLEHPHAKVVHPTDRHASVIGSLLLSAGAAGNLTTDAHLAALAIEHGATLASFDRDFTRFEGLSFERLHT